MSYYFAKTWVAPPWLLEACISYTNKDTGPIYFIYCSPNGGGRCVRWYNKFYILYHKCLHFSSKLYKVMIIMNFITYHNFLTEIIAFWAKSQLFERNWNAEEEMKVQHVLDASSPWIPSLRASKLISASPDHQSHVPFEPKQSWTPRAPTGLLLLPPNHPGPGP